MSGYRLNHTHWIVAGLCALAVLFLYKMWNSRLSQLDFQAYLSAVVAVRTGFNPYSDYRLEDPTDPGHITRFYYPPATIPFFSVFARPDFTTAIRMWKTFKILVMAALVGLWYWKFVRRDQRLLFFFLCALGFGLALYIDMSAGNISSLEQLALWAGFAGLLAGQPVIFALFVVLAAVPKWTLIAFLGLLLLSDFRKRWIIFSVALLIFISIQLIPMIWFPALYDSRVFTVLFDHLQPSMYNPSSLSFFTCLNEKLHLTGWDHKWLPAAAFSLWASTVGAITILSTRSAIKSKDWEMAIAICCFGYALVMPRMAIYCYLILIIPTLIVISRGAGSGNQWVMVGALVLITQPFNWLSFYLPVIEAFVLWLLAVNLNKERDASPERKKRKFKVAHI